MKTDFDLSEAICVFLGGPPNEGTIQIGNKYGRLVEFYGPENSDILITQIELLLDAIEHYAENDFRDDELTTFEWLSSNLPSLKTIARLKIEAHILHRLFH